MNRDIALLAQKEGAGAPASDEDLKAAHGS